MNVVNAVFWGIAAACFLVSTLDLKNWIAPGLLFFVAPFLYNAIF